MVAPAYYNETYVDTTLSANLDSTFAFEGPEKLLEVWFYESEPLQGEGLRAIPLESWVDVLDLVNCKVLSMKSSNEVDAYLLSESSLFVFSHKIILKTCGTTTTLSCLDKLFELVDQNVQKGYKSSDVARIFYSRRSFMFPLKQKHVHRDWKNEVNLLSKFFENGKLYVVGDFTSDDHWYLYMGGKSNVSSTPSDQTFEILMTELDHESAKNFVTTRRPGGTSLVHENEQEDHDLGHDIGLETMARTKLDSLFLEHEVFRSGGSYLPSPSLSDNLEYDEGKASEAVAQKDKFDFIHDAFSFTPCGYSSNSVSSSGNCYYTLHITPEAGWSYASFETNYPFHKSDTVTIIDVLVRVLEIFQPGKFSATLITDGGAEDEEVLANYHKLSNCSGLLKESFNYEKQERVLYDLKNDYKLLYLNFAKQK